MTSKYTISTYNYSKLVTIVLNFRHKDKKMVGFHGFLGKTIMIIDVDLLKQIVIKDIDYFLNKPIFDLGNKDLNAILTQIEGEKWRQARHASTPVFTSGKLKKMSKLMKKVCDDLIAHVDKLASTGEEVDAKQMSMKFTVTVIANAGFGIDANVLDGSPRGAQFYKMARIVTGAEQTRWDIIKAIIGLMLPKSIMKALGIDLINKSGVNFFNDIINQRLNMTNAQSSKRNDMVGLFTETMRGQDEEDIKEETEKDLEGSNLAQPNKLTNEEMDAIMRGNLFAMFLAGMEFPAVMMSGCLYFLAKNPDVQERLLEEIQESNLGEVLEYNTIMNLPYLDMVVQEAMRHTSPADGNWQCSKDYKVPGTNITIPKGMNITLSANGICMDERYFPNPTKFDPEHFNSKNKESRSPATDVVFSIGPRKCIGNRFALLQFKTGIANMVKNFRILPTQRLPEKYDFDPKSGAMDIQGGIWVKFEKRE